MDTHAQQSKLYIFACLITQEWLRLECAHFPHPVNMRLWSNIRWIRRIVFHWFLYRYTNWKVTAQMFCWVNMHNMDTILFNLLFVIIILTWLDFSLFSHSTKNWIFRELPVAETTAQYWEKRDTNPNVFILKLGRDTLKCKMITFRLVQEGFLGSQINLNVPNVIKSPCRPTKCVHGSHLKGVFVCRTWKVNMCY